MDAAEHHQKVQEVLATLLIEGGAVRPRDISVLSLENETVVLEYRDDTVDPNARPSMPMAWEKLRSAVEGAGLSVTMRREEVEPPSLPQVSVPRRSKRAGSARRTPASINASAWRRW